MSRRRYISTSMSTDNRLNKLASVYGDFAALLYTWMIPHAADDTTLNGDIDEFMAIIIPMRRDKGADEVIAALDGMAELGLIIWEKEASQIRFPAAAFYGHQTFIRKENRVEDWPAPTNADERRETPQKAASLTPSLTVTPPVSVSVSPPAAAPADADASDLLPPVLRAWESATGTLITQMTADLMDHWIGEVGQEWVLDAITETNVHGAKAWGYTVKILERWKREGREVQVDSPAKFRTLESVFPGMRR